MALQLITAVLGTGVLLGLWVASSLVASSLVASSLVARSPAAAGGAGEEGAAGEQQTMGCAACGPGRSCHANSP